VNRIPALFVERPPLVFVLLALIVLAGIFGAVTIVQQEFPNVDSPTVTVSATYPGAAPSELRDSVVRPLEDAIAGAAGLESLTSSIQQNQATISATFALSTSKATDLTEIQDRIQAVKAALPQDLPAPTVRSFDPSQATIVTLAVTSSALSLADLSGWVTNTLVPRLEQIPGVANVTANGVVTPALEVLLNPFRLTGAQLSPTDVVAAIQANNARLPGGIITQTGYETNLDVRGDLTTPSAVDATPILATTSVLSGATSTSGAANIKYSQQSGSTNQALQLSNTGALLPQQLRIGDIATTEDSYEPRRVFSYLGGRAAITLNVQKEAGASEVTASQAVLAALPQITAEYPQVRFETINVQADETWAQLIGVVQSLLEGIAFTGIVMLFFLGSWRNALIVLIAIPASLAVTIFVMRLANFTLDTVSLLAMTLIIGILVDDAIVVVENSERIAALGVAPAMAAIRGRAEIAAAAVTITLVDVVVFLPIVFLPGQTGRYLGEFGVVVTIATLTSLMVSFTITPALLGRWALVAPRMKWRLIEAFGRGLSRVRTWYTDWLLPRALRNPLKLVGFAVLCTVGAIALVPLGVIGFEFIPAVDRGQIFVRVAFPTGTPIATTDAAIRSITNRFLRIHDIQRIIGTTGTAQSGFGGGVNLASTGQLRVFLRPDHRQTTDRVAQLLTKLGTELVPFGKIVAIPATGTRGGNAQPIDITVSTTRGDAQAPATQIVQLLQQIPGTRNVNSSALQLSPQLDILFDRERARVLNVDIGLASQAVRAAFGGTTATQFDTSNGTKVIQVLYPAHDQRSTATLLAIPIRTKNGRVIHLGDVAQLVADPVTPLISRTNRTTVIHVGANLAPGASLSGIQRSFQQRLATLHLPHSVLVGTGTSGSERNLDQTTKGIGVSLLLSSFLVYLLMLALYDSYITPLIIMTAIPFAAIGALGALALTGQSLNLFSMIGLLMLLGLVSKNGILLVDFTQQHIAEGIPAHQAVLAATRERFRPIIMTTVSMIAGMLPLALAVDPGSTARRSLGTVVIGGLTSSLLLTLVIVPIVTLFVERIRHRVPPYRPSEAAPHVAD